MPVFMKTKQHGDALLNRRGLLAGASAAILAGCTAKGAAPSPPRLVPVGNRSTLFWTPFSLPGYEECQTRIQHVNGAVDVSEIRLRFVGWAIDAAAGNSGEMDAPNDLEVWAAVEYPVGNIHVASFVGADRGWVRPGETIDTDVLDLTIPAGAAFHVRCLVRAGAGGHFPFGLVCKSGIDGWEAGPTGALTNKVLGGDIGGIANHYSVYSAAAVLGVAQTPAHGVVIFGDSIAYGFDLGLSEDTPDGGDAQGRRGFVARALGELGINSVNISAPGLTAYKPAAAPDILTRRLAFVADIGDVVINTLGRNDWGSYSQTDIVTLSAQDTLTALFERHQLRTILATSLPWTDPANTRFGGDLATNGLWRDRYNAALRARAAVQPVLDVASVGERNGLWIDKRWETDGIHPNTVGHAGIAKAILPQLKTLMNRIPLPATVPAP